MCFILKHRVIVSVGSIIKIMIYAILMFNQLAYTYYLF